MHILRTAARRRRRPRHCIVHIAARWPPPGHFRDRPRGRKEEREREREERSHLLPPTQLILPRVLTYAFPQLRPLVQKVRMHLVNNTIRLVGLLRVLSPMRPAQQIQSIALTKPRSTKLTLGNDRLRYAALSPRAENVHRLGGRAANEKKNSKRKEGGTEGERTAVPSNSI